MICRNRNSVLISLHVVCGKIQMAHHHRLSIYSAVIHPSMAVSPSNIKTIMTWEKIYLEGLFFFSCLFLLLHSPCCVVAWILLYTFAFQIRQTTEKKTFRSPRPNERTNDEVFVPFFRGRLFCRLRRVKILFVVAIWWRMEVWCNCCKPWKESENRMLKFN